LPFRGNNSLPRARDRIIIAHHLVMTLYGQWLPTTCGERVQRNTQCGPGRPWSVVFIYDPAGVRGPIKYINLNPRKEKLPPQRFLERKVAEEGLDILEKSL
jgi:hypothetical protein